MSPPATRLAFLPRLDAGLTLFHRPSRRSTALHQLVVNELPHLDGPAYWVDLGRAASTYVLYELSPRGRGFEHLQIARAFTAYQHHTLVKQLVHYLEENPGLIIATEVSYLYLDDEVPDYVGERLFASTLAILSEIGRTLDIPVLVTSARTRTDPFQEDLEAAADSELWCEQTPEGFSYTSEDFQTDIYVKRGYWQTTIPYWVDLYGAVEDFEIPILTREEQVEMTAWIG